MSPIGFPYVAKLAKRGVSRPHLLRNPCREHAYVSRHVLLDTFITILSAVVPPTVFVYSP